MYSKIINPKTGRLVNINGSIGREILKKNNIEQSSNIRNGNYIPIPVVKHNKTNLYKKWNNSTGK